jgi:hypothetical protein
MKVFIVSSPGLHLGENGREGQKNEITGTFISVRSAVAVVYDQLDI